MPKSDPGSDARRQQRSPNAWSGAGLGLAIGPVQVSFGGEADPGRNHSALEAFHVQIGVTFCGSRHSRNGKDDSMRPLLLWLIGVPLPVVILIWVFFF